MAAYRRVYDSRHLQADCQELGSAPEGTLRATFTFLVYLVALYFIVSVMVNKDEY